MMKQNMRIAPGTGGRGDLKNELNSLRENRLTLQKILWQADGLCMGLTHRSTPRRFDAHDHHPARLCLIQIAIGE